MQRIIEDIWQNRNRDYNVRALVKRLLRIDKQMSGDARELFARFIPNGDVASFAADLPRLMRQSFDSTMRILRDPDFQRLLTDYPRASAPFVVAPAVDRRGRLRVAHPGRRRQGVQARRLSAGIR